MAFYGTLVDPPAQKTLWPKILRWPKIPLWPKSPLELAPELKAPVLGLYGGADAHIAPRKSRR